MKLVSVMSHRGILCVFVQSFRRACPRRARLGSGDTHTEWVQIPAQLSSHNPSNSSIMSAPRVAIIIYTMYGHIAKRK